MREPSFICDYTIEQEGRRKALVLNCKECEKKGHDLIHTECFRGSLSAFSSEVNIDTLTTAHYLESQYLAGPVEVFGDISQFISDLEELGNRDTVQEYKKKDAKGRYGSLCPKCGANPRNIFPGLEKAFRKDPKSLLGHLKTHVGAVPANDAASMCADCKKKTVEELDFAFRSYKELTRKIWQFGFDKTVRG